jgi:hypothetical protein
MINPSPLWRRGRPLEKNLLFCASVKEEKEKDGKP